MKLDAAIALLIAKQVELITTDRRYSPDFALGLSISLMSSHFPARPQYGISVGVHLENVEGQDDDVAIIGQVGFANEKMEDIIKYTVKQFSIPDSAEWDVWPEKKV